MGRGRRRCSRGAARGCCLIDPSHPREKPCGGGVTGRALAIVGDRFPAGRLPSVRIRAARFIESNGRREADVPLPRDGDGPSRREPHRIRRAHYCRAPDVREPICRRAASRRQARWRGVRADHVRRRAGDHGVRRRGGRREQSGQTQIVHAVSAQSAVDRDRVLRARRHTAIAIVIEMFADPPGYIWSFPRPDHLAIGICAQADAGVGVDRLRDMVRRWMQSTGDRRRCPTRAVRLADSIALSGRFPVARARRTRLVDRRRRRRPRGSDHEGRHFLRAAIGGRCRRRALGRRHPTTLSSTPQGFAMKSAPTSRARRATKPVFSHRASRGCWWTHCTQAKRSVE